MGFENVGEAPIPPGERLHQRYRHEFPVTGQLIYLNHAALGPLCRPAADAMRNAVDDALTFGSLHYDQWLAAYAGLRRAAAWLINAQPSEIAIVKNTSEGISTVARGIAWRPGDRIVAFTEEFPANYYPWLRLESSGVQIRWHSIHDDLSAIAESVAGARLLAVSFVNYLDGHRMDLAALGRLCREHGCLFFVDAIQGLGALPVDVEACNIDALAADGHKWMLGPEGNGILFVRREWLEAIEPVEFGWTNRQDFFDHKSRGMTLRPDAGRYECGTLNTVGCFGQRAAIEFLLEVGIDRIQEAVLARADQLARGVAAKGYQMNGTRSPHHASGIVSFRHPTLDSDELRRSLQEQGVLAASRQQWLRASPHFYNSPEEINRFLECLPDA